MSPAKKRHSFSLEGLEAAGKIAGLSKLDVGDILIAVTDAVPCWRVISEDVAVRPQFIDEIEMRQQPYIIRDNTAHSMSLA